MPTEDLRLMGPRLDLVAATPALLEAELGGKLALARFLDVEVPASWPPGLYLRDEIEQSLEVLRDDPATAGWWMWYLLCRQTGGVLPVLVGLCCYKGRPNPEGTVEIGCSVLAEHHRQGYAREAIELLFERAFAQPEVRAVVVETYLDATSSIAALEKRGFRRAGPGSEARMIRFELPRESYAAG